MAGVYGGGANKEGWVRPRLSAAENRRYLELRAQGFFDLDRFPTVPLLMEEVASKHDNDGSENTYRSNRPIRSLDELVTAAKIDLTKNVIVSWECGTWGVTMKMRKKGQDDVAEQFTNWKVSVKLRPLGPFDMNWELFKKEMAAFGKRVPKIKTHLPPGAGELLVVNIADLHLDKLCWWEETGENYDTKIAEGRFWEAMQALIGRLQGRNIERIVFVVGNDFFNTDGLKNATTNDTPQDTDVRWQNSFVKGKRLMVEAIDWLKAFAPVDVLVIPGNHDTQRAFYLGDTIASWFRLDENVSVDNAPTQRKYYRFGRTMIQFLHGDKGKPEKWESAMAAEQPEMWGETLFRYIIFGDKHHRTRTQMNGSEAIGMPSPAGTDAWHGNQMYLSNQAIDFLMFDRERGHTTTEQYNFVGHKGDTAKRRTKAA